MKISIFFITLFIIIITTVSAQNYSMFNSSSKKLFFDGANTYNLSFDSSITLGGDIFYYNYFNVNANINVDPVDCYSWGGGCIPQNLSSWMGNKIKLNSSNKYVFYTSYNDSLSFDMDIAVGDTTIFYNDSSETFVIIRQNDTIIQIATASDSARIFKIIHKDNFGNFINSNLNNQNIIVAKDFGLINFIRIDSFPTSLQSVELIGNKNPDVGFTVITADKVYDYQPGDEYQIEEISSCGPSPCPSSTIIVYRTHRILSRTDNLNSITYSIQEELFYQNDSTLTTTVISKTYDKTDTLATIPFEFLFDNNHLRKLTFKEFGARNFWAYENSNSQMFIYCESENCWAYNDAFYDPYYYKNIYVLGLGDFYYSKRKMNFSFQGYTITEQMIYFKKNGITWGNEAIVGIVDEKREKKFSISPIPASNNLSINSSYSLISGVRILSLNGKISITEKVNNKTIAEINISALSAGIYFIEVYFENNNKEIRKFIKQ